MEINVDNTLLKLIQGDITVEKTDAIVNAANSSLLGGGGVDGAIHRAGGPAILSECRIIRAKQGPLPAGEAVVTTAGNMAAKFVIHTVGPVWTNGSKGEPELLKNAYKNSLAAGASKNLKSISFPSISTGVYGYPKDKACNIAFNTVYDFIKIEKHCYEEVRFVVFSDEDFELYKNLFKEKLN